MLLSSWSCLVIQGLSFLVAALPQTNSSTNIAIGSLDPGTTYPKCLPSGFNQNCPWTSQSGAGPTPHTGIVRYYNFVISRGTIAPDGIQKSVILVNNQFPGPLIEANWGDTIQVTVTNLIHDDEEGTTIHWHGLLQQSTPWYDGVPGVSQCPIAPGDTFTYSFIADQFGTSWYHSHYSAQYSDGLFGPMMIYGPLQEGVDYDYDLGPIILTDYIHESYYQQLLAFFAIPPAFATINSNLINGQGVYPCSEFAAGQPCNPYQPTPKFHFQSGKTYRLRLMNTGGAASQKFSIDNHQLTVIANDYVPLVPYTTEVVTLGIGQRTDVLVTANGRPNEVVYMRADVDVNCANTTVEVANATATIYYQDANPNAVPSSTPYPWSSNNCLNDPLTDTVPYYVQTPPAEPATTTTFDITVNVNGSGNLLFYVNDVSFRTNYDYPILLLTSEGNVSYPLDPQWNVYDYGKNTSIRAIVYNYFSLPHPMHLHGHAFWVLAEGAGTWDGTVTNPSNPQRRDTHLVQPGSPTYPSYAVFEWEANNPGIWPFHCHTSIHVSSGLYVSIMERPDLLLERQIPIIEGQTCNPWAQFAAHDYVDQIDSGE